MALILGGLGLRYKPERDEDQPDAKAALQLLMEDLSDVQPHFLEQAVREISRTRPKHFGLPGASEVIQLCKDILDRNKLEPVAGELDTRGKTARCYNIDNASTGSPFRWTKDMELFRIGDLGERRASRDDGSIIEPWFKRGEPGSGDGNTWHPPEGCTNLLNAAYERHGSRYRVVAGQIVEPDFV